MRKPFLIVFLVVLVGGAFYIQSRLHLFTKPCGSPITYSLGTLDSQFDISQSDFLADINRAATIWDDPTGKVLFKYDPNASMKINLVYDNRQQATDKLKSLGYTITDTQASYDSLKLRYNSMTSNYNSLKQSLDNEVANYNTKRQAYESQVNYWNSQGGAPKNMANQLNAQASELNAAAAKIQADENTLNGLANDLNAAADALNSMAKSLNLNVSKYNNVGQSRGGEFEEGEFVQTGNTRTINIYEFQNQSTLVRVLAHELGHSLGLEHVTTDPNAIMYYVNQGNAQKATAADISAVNQLCGFTN